ncbi:hypothetical protein [Burkholderia cenocepacia]|uniref:hypothetical protein n=1 Tax=Burkholderia cenocepacia TaxID=95486 RepID=UPI00114C9619|nr:hypothetical protein [Burkholderia cenocepacia]
MTENSDGGIVQGYLNRFMQLGTKSQLGEDVQTQLVSLVGEARDQLAIWINGDPEQNKAKLVGGLRSNAGLTAYSSPVLAKTLMHAVEMLT